MSGRSRYDWRTAPEESDGDEDDDDDDEEEDDDDDVRGSMLDSSLSRRLQQMAKDVAQLETEKYLALSRKQRKIERLEEDTRDLEEAAANLRYELMKKDDEISKLKAKLRTQTSATAQREETVLLRLKIAVLLGCIQEVQHAAGRALEKHPDVKELQDIESGVCVCLCVFVRVFVCVHAYVSVHRLVCSVVFTFRTWCSTNL